MPVIFLLAALLVSLLPGVDAEPRAILLKRLKVNCNRVVVAFKSDNPGGALTATVRLLVNGDEVVSQSGAPTGFAAEFSFDPPPGDYTVTGEITVGAEILTVTLDITCGKTKTKKNDKRICFAPGQAPVAVYAKNGLEVWAIDADDSGVQVIDVRDRDLRRLPDFPPRVEFIARSDTLIRVEFMKNPDGGFQLNVGPDAEGKVFECLFRFSALDDAVVRTWLVP